MTHSSLRASARAVVVAAALMCAAQTQARADVTITDASGRQVAVKDTSRILSIGGDVTEILYALTLRLNPPYSDTHTGWLAGAQMRSLAGLPSLRAASVSRDCAPKPPDHSTGLAHVKKHDYQSQEMRRAVHVTQ